MFPFTATYSTMGFSRPNDMIDPKNKDEHWHRQWAEFIYSYFLRDLGLVPYSQFNEMMLHRMYSEGTQPVDKYMDRMAPTNSNGEREGFYNLPWDNLAILPKFKRVFMNLVHQELKVLANSIDERSTSKKAYIKHRLWALNQMRPYLEALKKTQPGMELPFMQEFIPEDMDELDMYEKVGGIKLPEEIAWERLIEYSLKCGNMAEIQRRIENDFFDHGAGVVMDVMDPNTQKIVPKYIDYLYYITQRTGFSDNSKSDFDAHVEWYTFGDLRNATKGQITDEKLLEIANFYFNVSPSTLLNNSDTDYWYNTVFASYNNMKIPVLHCNVVSVDMQVHQERTAHNQVYIYKEDFDYNKNNENRKTKVTSLKVRRMCSWIIGTNSCFNFGLQNDIPRPSKGECRSPYHLYKVTNKSMCASVIPNVDQIQNAWNRLNNAISMASPSGVAINISAIQGMKLGKQDMSELEILDIRRATGDLLYKSTTHYNGQPGGAPVGAGIMQELKGGMGEYGVEQLMIIEKNLGFIRDIIGIGNAADPTANDADNPVKTSQTQYAQTEGSLDLYRHGYRQILQSLGKNISLRYKIASMFAEWEEMDDVIGAPDAQLIRLSKDMSAMNMGIFFDAKPDSEQRARILVMAEKAMNPANGAPGLTMSDYFYIERCLDTSVGIKYAQMYLGYRENKAQQQVAQQKTNDIMANGQVQQQSALVASQLKRQEAITEAMLKKELIDREKAWDFLIQQAKGSQANNATFVKAGTQIMVDMFGNLQAELGAPGAGDPQQQPPEQPMGGPQQADGGLPQPQQQSTTGINWDSNAGE